MKTRRPARPCRRRSGQRSGERSFRQASKGRAFYGRASSRPRFHPEARRPRRITPRLLRPSARRAHGDQRHAGSPPSLLLFATSSPRRAGRFRRACAQIVAPPVARTAGAAGRAAPSSRCGCESLKVDVEVAGGAAETRVRMVFFNPNARTLEGKLQFPLAPGQIVSGFALDVDGRMRTAVPVEKARAAAGVRGHLAPPRRPGPAADDDRQQLRAARLPAAAGQDAHGRADDRRGGVGLAAHSARLRGAVARSSSRVRLPNATAAPELASASPLGLRFERAPGGGYVARRAAPTSPCRARR